MASADRLIEVFHEAKARPAGAERERFVAAACRDDASLKEQVLSLLRAHEGAGDFLKSAIPSPTSVPTEKPGDKIGHYKLLEQIGEGGCGVVYMAEQDEPVRRRVALKIIKLGMDTKQVIARFEAERQALALMDHPNIAKVFDAGATEGRLSSRPEDGDKKVAAPIPAGRPFFVMELVRGIKITDYCDQNNLSTTERLDLFIQVCHAVQHAHQKGVIHRDIKPSNILVAQHDTVAVPKVIDFGIAKATTDQRLTDKTLFTAFEQFIGTPAYMSPEQAQLSGLDIDTRTDIYSLGVLLYELLTGKTPFETKELMAAGLDEMRRTIREREPLKPSTRLTQELVAADVSRRKSTDGDGKEISADSRRRLQAMIGLLRGDLDWIVMKCLEKDRARRYETANGLATDLKRHLTNEPVIARSPSAAYRFRKMVRRNRLAFGAAIMVAATLLLGASVSTWQAIRATRESARARKAESKAREESDLAKRQEQRANASLYTANMRMAQFAWAQNSASQVRQLLQETAAYPARGFEWFYWQRQTHLQLETLRGHRSGVLAVAASRDSRQIVTGSQDRTAKVWESGHLVRTLGPHGGPVSSVALSPDGKRIVTGSWDHTVKLWETASGNLLRTLRGHHGEVFSVAFSRDGQRIVTGSRDATAIVWDVTKESESELILRGHSNWVWSAAFSEDGRWIITGSQDHTAKVWDAATGKALLNFTNHSGPIQSVAISPDGRRVATASRDLTTRVWDVSSGWELLPALKGHSDAIHSVAFSPDGRRLATGSFDQTAKVWDASNGTELFTIRGHGSPISSVGFSADGQRLITGGGYVSIDPPGNSLSPGGGDGTAKVWAASRDQETLTLRGHNNKIMAVAFSPDSQRIITGSFDKTAKVWDADSGKALFSLPHDTLVRAVAYSPDGQRLATGSLDGAARVWSATTEKLLMELLGHSDKILSVAFSSDGQRVVTGSADGTARVWSAVDGKPLATLAGGGGWIFSVAFSPDGQWIVTGSNDASSIIWDAATGTKVRNLIGHEWGVNGVAVSRDGQRIITGSGDATARIWEAHTGKQLVPLNGQTVEFYSVAFSPDGQRVVTAGKERAARVWDASNGQQLLTLTGHSDEIWSVAFSPDGQRIVTGSWDGTAKVWQAASAEQVLRWRREDQAAQN